MKTECFIVHNWDKWGEATDQYCANKIQYRQCKTCGKIQSRKIGFFNGITAKKIMESFSKEHL